MTSFLDGNVVVSDSSSKIKIIDVRFGEIGYLPGSEKALIQSKKGIDSIIAQSIYADIIADFQNFDSTTVGPIGDISTSNGGDFIGLIQGTHITGSGIHIDGDLIGEMRLGNQFGQGSAVPFNIFDPPIRIGGSLSLGSIIKLPDTGTLGTIIFNGNNAGDNWDGTVQIGAGASPLQLTDPEYTNLPSELGGGAIGVAPFNLHDEACTPANGFIWPSTGQAPITEVRLRHYGNIKRVPGTDPVVIKRRFVKCGVETFGPDIASQFTNIVSSSDNSLVLQGDFQYGYEYKIIPTSDLLSFNVTGEPQVSQYDYIITLNNSACVADSDGNGSVDVLDLLDLLADWGSCIECVTDSNCSDDVNVLDLLDLLAAWWSCGTPPSYESQIFDDDTHATEFGTVSDIWSMIRNPFPLFPDLIYQIAADDFTTTAAGDVTQVHWWGFYEDGGEDCQSGYNDSFTITYYDSVLHSTTNKRIPGAVIATVTDQPTRMLMPETLGNDLPLFMYSLNHDPIALADNGCYFIEIKNSGGDAVSYGCHWYWAWSEEPQWPYSVFWLGITGFGYGSMGDPEHSKNLSFSLDIPFTRQDPANLCAQ